MFPDRVKTYAYDFANRLIEVSDQSSVTSLSYNGLGQRLSMSAGGITNQYVMDGDQPLTASSSGNTTFYLHGFGVIGEKSSAWSYSLPDGTNTPRQLTDLSGGISLSGRYSPWGDTLETYGDGGFAFGYFGGLMDGATGLLYVGNGQYYDPTTGRFLTRDAKPNGSNPYVPWDPSGALIAPLGLLAAYYSRKRKGGKWGMWIALLLVLASASMTLAACGPGGGSGSTPAPTVPPGETPTPVGPGTSGAGTPPAPGAAFTATAIPCPTPSTPTPTATPTPYALEYIADFNLSGYYTPVMENQGWNEKNVLVETDPRNTGAYAAGKYLSKDGHYTNDASQALSAPKDFLNYGEGVCTQGTGKVNGLVILCSTTFPDPIKFEWGALGDLRAYQTVARCGSSRLLRQGDFIYIDAPWFNDQVLGPYNAQKILEITDTGNAPGLCDSKGHEGIDLYFGEGKPAYQAWSAFVAEDSLQEQRVGIYWRIYRVMK